MSQWKIALKLNHANVLALREEPFPTFTEDSLLKVLVTGGTVRSDGGIVGWCAEAAEVCVALKAAGSGGK